MSSIGTAYINIAPNMSGIQGKIANGLSGSGSAFSDKFTSEISGKSAVIIGAISGVVSSAVSASLNLITNQFNAAINRFDVIQNFPKVMSNFGISTNDASDAMKVLVAGVAKLPTSLNSIVSLTEAFTPMSKSVADASKLALALNDALLAGGTSMDVQSNAMEQFRQALAKGMPQLQDWRSIELAMPAQLQQIAKALGLGSGAMKDFGTNGQGIYNAMQAGDITMQDFNDTLLRLDQTGLGTLPNFQVQAKNASNGVATSFTVLQQKIQQVMVNIMTTIGQQNISNAIQSVGDAVAVVGNGFSNVIKFIIQNKDAFVPIAAGIATAAAAVLLYNQYMKIAAAVTAAQAVASIFLSAVIDLQSQGVGLLKAAWIALDTAMDANPIGLIALAIGGLVAGIIFLENKFHIFSDAWKQFMDFIRPAVDWFVQNVWPILQKIGAWIGSAFAYAWNNLKTAIDSINKTLKDAGINFNVLDVVIAIVGIALLVLAAPLLLVIGLIVGVALVVANLVGWFAQLYAWEAKISMDAAKNIGNFAKSIGDGIASVIGFFAAIPGNVGKFLGEAVTNVGNFVGSIGAWFGAIPKNIGNFLSDAVKNVGSFIGGVGAWFASLPYAIGYGLGQAIGQIIQWGQSIGSFFTTTIPQIINNVGQWFGSLPGIIGGAVSGAFNAVVNWFGSIGNWLGTYVPQIIGNIGAWFGSLPGTIGGFLASVVGAVGAWFGSLPGIVGGFLASVAGAIGGWFASIGATVGTGASNIIGSIGQWFGSLPGMFMNIGRNIVGGIQKGIGDAWGGLTSSVGNFINGLVDGVKNKLGIHSPSVVFSGIGDNITQGLINGITANVTGVTNAVSVISDAAMQPLSAVNPSVAVSGAIAGAGPNDGSSNSGASNTFTGNIYLGDQGAVKEFFSQLNQGTINAGMGITPTEGVA